MGDKYDRPINSMMIRYANLYRAWDIAHSLELNGVANSVGEEMNDIIEMLKGFEDGELQDTKETGTDSSCREDNQHHSKDIQETQRSQGIQGVPRRRWSI